MKTNTWYKKLKSKYKITSNNTEDTKFITKKDEEGYGFSIRALISGKEVGKVVVMEEYVDDDHPFGPYKELVPEDLYDKITSHHCVINISYLEVDSRHRGQGLASKLMERALKSIKKKYPGDPIYINASPMMDKSAPLDALIKFYQKFGFKLLKKFTKFQNALLWKE